MIRVLKGVTFVWTVLNVHVLRTNIKRKKKKVLSMSLGLVLQACSSD